jgi:hypothetical protein
MPLIDDFKARFPEFDAAVVDQRLPIFEAIWPCYFCGDYSIPCDKEAILNLIAHLLVMDQSAGSNGATAVGNVQSKSVGNVSVSYKNSAVQTWDNDFFGGTKYGMMFLNLNRGRSKPVFV